MWNDLFFLNEADDDEEKKKNEDKKDDEEKEKEDEKDDDSSDEDYNDLIDDEEDLDKLPKGDTNNTVYAILRKDGKNLIYLYSKEVEDYVLINGDLEEINTELESINEQLDNKANLDDVFLKENGINKVNNYFEDKYNVFNRIII